MKIIAKNIGNNLHHFITLYRFNKIQILFFLMFFFSLIYMLLDDSHFEGVNKFKELVKEEVIKDKVQKEIKENFELYEQLDTYYKDNKVIEEKVIDKAAKDTEKEVKKDELVIEKIEPSLINKFINRIYFSIITGCLLGYGDVYPVSNAAKLLTGLQGLLTVSLIIY